MLATIFAIGAIGGLLSGMLGVGGAVLLLPLLTTFAGLSLKEASNITVVQVAASAAVSVVAYYRDRLVYLRLALWIGGASAVGGLVGGYGSRAVSARALELVFLVVVLIAIGLLLIPVADGAGVDGEFPAFNPWLAAAIGGTVGALAGLLGAGGGFLIVPLMIGVMKIPTRLAIGTSPVVILISSVFALAGKTFTGQIDPRLAAALVAGAMPAAYVGTIVGRRVPPRVLRLMLGAILVAIVVRGVLLLGFRG